jgi:hypothetical protein
VKFTATARSLGIISAAATVILVVAYAVTLTVGLLSLESPQFIHLIAKRACSPMFTYGIAHTVPSKRTRLMP